jgi:hypothetical protein
MGCSEPDARPFQGSLTAATQLPTAILLDKRLAPLPQTRTASKSPVAAPPHMLTGTAHHRADLEPCASPPHHSCSWQVLPKHAIDTPSCLNMPPVDQAAVYGCTSAVYGCTSAPPQAAEELFSTFGLNLCQSDRCRTALCPQKAQHRPIPHPTITPPHQTRPWQQLQLAHRHGSCCCALAQGTCPALLLLTSLHLLMAQLLYESA